MLAAYAPVYFGAYERDSAANLNEQSSEATYLKRTCEARVINGHIWKFLAAEYRPMLTVTCVCVCVCARMFMHSGQEQFCCLT